MYALVQRTPDAVAAHFAVRCRQQALLQRTRKELEQMYPATGARPAILTRASQRIARASDVQRLRADRCELSVPNKTFGLAKIRFLSRRKRHRGLLAMVFAMVVNDRRIGGRTGRQGKIQNLFRKQKVNIR